MAINTIRNAALHRVCCCACFVMLCVSSCNSRTLESADNVNGTIKGDETLYYLDNRKPSLTQPIEPADARPAAYKFVRVEVVEVLNPKKYLLTFEVHYQSKSGEKIYLGSFSLYPADNPGKFIVATQGKVKEEGAIILSLVTPDKIDAGDTVKVAVKKIKLVKG
jgi:uncharacterized OB-fold protein